jgi:membrane-bound lytic murein transglycosylase B
VDTGRPYALAATASWIVLGALAAAASAGAATQDVAAPASPAAQTPTPVAQSAPAQSAATSSAVAPSSASAAAAPAPAPVVLPSRFDVTRPDIRRFVAEVAKRDDLSKRRVLRLLRKAQPQPRIIELMSRPAERVLQWWEYRQIFVTDRRINEGVQFWLDHRLTLEHIAAQQGIPPEYLVAILGCETFYGRITGRDRVLDALATLAFEYPPRGEYFRGELEQFLLLTREEHLDPLEVKGSYSGAMGAPQFMPSAYRRYAVDASHDRRRDLWNDWADVIASVANFLRQNGWQPGEPVLAEARLDPDPTFQLDAKGEVSATLDQLNAQGVRVDLSVPGTTPVVLVSAEQKEGPAYRVGFANFRAITRYNHSARYAMAVNDLAQGIAERVRATHTEVPPS